MSQPPLDLNRVGIKIPEAKISLLDLTHVGAKIPDPKTPTLQMEISKQKEKA